MSPLLAASPENEISFDPTSLNEAMSAVVRRAQQQGYILPREIREELKHLDMPAAAWKDIVAKAQPALRLRRGRYYYLPSASNRMQEEQKHLQDIHTSVRRIIRHYKKAAKLVERREQDRLDFIQPVQIRTEEGQEINLLSRDLSATGIRLVGTCRLLGQKVTVTIPDAEGGTPARFVARILWTCAVGDGLFENGGRFLEIAKKT
jgi:hypothetical protein